MTNYLALQNKAVTVGTAGFNIECNTILRVFVFLYFLKQTGLILLLTQLLCVLCEV